MRCIVLQRVLDRFPQAKARTKTLWTGHGSVQAAETSLGSEKAGEQALASTLSRVYECSHTNRLGCGLQRREEQKEKLASLNLLEPPAEEEDDDKEDSEDEDAKAVTKVMHFDDAHTQNKFGDVVTVTTSIGDLKSDSEDEISDEDYDLSDDDEAEGVGKRDGAHSKFREKQLSLFQRIQLKRRGMALPSKRAKLKEARTNRKATLGKKSHKAKAPSKKDAVEVVAAGGGKPKKGAFGKGKFSKR